MAGTEGSPVFSRIGLGIQLVAVIIFIVGFSGEYWSTAEFTIPGVGTVTSHLGLFKGCNSFAGCTSDGADDWQKASTGLEIAGLIFSVAALACMVLYEFVRKSSWASKVRATLIVMAFIAAITILAGCIVFAEYRDQSTAKYGVGMDLDWSFILAAIGGSAEFVAAIVYVIDVFV